MAGLLDISQVTRPMSERIAGYQKLRQNRQSLAAGELALEKERAGLGAMRRTGGTLQGYFENKIIEEKQSKMSALVDAILKTGGVSMLEMAWPKLQKASPDYLGQIDFESFAAPIREKEEQLMSLGERKMGVAERTAGARETSAAASMLGAQTGALKALSSFGAAGKKTPETETERFVKIYSDLISEQEKFKTEGKEFPTRKRAQLRAVIKQLELGEEKAATESQEVARLLRLYAQGKATEQQKKALFLAKGKRNFKFSLDKEGNLSVTLGDADESVTDKLTMRTKGIMQKNILEAGSRLSELTKISKSFDEDYLNVIGSFKGTITNWADYFKSSQLLPGDFPKFLRDQRKFRAAAQTQALVWRKWVTGVATNPTEIVEIAKSFPNPVHDEPIEFKAKLDFVINLTANLMNRMQTEGVLKLTPEQIMQEAENATTVAYPGQVAAPVLPDDVNRLQETPLDAKDPLEQFYSR